MIENYFRCFDNRLSLSTFSFIFIADLSEENMKNNQFYECERRERKTFLYNSNIKKVTTT